MRVGQLMSAELGGGGSGVPYPSILESPRLPADHGAGAIGGGAGSAGGAGAIAIGAGGSEPPADLLKCGGIVLYEEEGARRGPIKARLLVYLPPRVPVQQ